MRRIFFFVSPAAEEQQFVSYFSTVMDRLNTGKMVHSIHEYTTYRHLLRYKVFR